MAPFRLKLCVAVNDILACAKAEATKTPWMNRSEAAAYVSISRRTLDRSRENCHLSTYLIVGTTCKRFRRDELDESLGAPKIDVSGLQSWLSISQAAEYLRVSTKTISRLRSQGALKSYYTGLRQSCPRFRRIDLDRLLEYTGS